MKLLKNIYNLIIAFFVIIYVLIEAWFETLLGSGEEENNMEYNDYNKEKKEFEDRYNYLKKLKENNPEQFKKELRYYIINGCIPKDTELEK